MQKFVKLLLVSLSYLFLTCQAQEPQAKAPPKRTAFTNEMLRKLPPAGKITLQPTPGAPTSITRNIIQDSQGIIWLATFEGMVTFDGEVFTNVTEEITSSRFFTALEGINGDLWFGTIGSGVFRYDGKTFTNFSTSNGLVSDKITNIYQDERGRIWFGGVEGLSIYDGNTFENLTKEQGLPNNDVNDVVLDKNGHYWIVTRGQSCIYDGENFRIITTDAGESLSNIRHVIRDRYNNMWVGGNNGLWRYDGEAFTQIAAPFTGYIYEDTAGNIWTSAESITSSKWALRRYDASTINDAQPEWEELITGEGMFFGITEDSEGFLWAGTLQGAYRYDGQAFTDFKTSKKQE